MKTTLQSAAERESVLAVKEIFQNAIVDEIVPHDRIREIVKSYYPNAPNGGYEYKSIRSLSAGIVRKVRTILNQEAGMIFVCVNSKGYRRLDQINGVLYAGTNPLVRTRKLMRRSYKQLSNTLLHTNDMSANDRRKTIQRLATFGLIEHLTMEKTVVTMPEELNYIDPLKALKDALGV